MRTLVGLRKSASLQRLVGQCWRVLRYFCVLEPFGYATGTDIDERKRNEERTKNENIALREEFDHSLMFEAIVGSSQSLRKVLKAVDKEPQPIPQC